MTIKQLVQREGGLTEAACWLIRECNVQTSPTQVKRWIKKPPAPRSAYGVLLSAHGIVG